MSEREWREASDMRSSLVSVGLVVLSAALLRYWNLRHGAVTPEETQIADAVVGLLRTGFYRPPALTHPTLTVYLQALVAIAHFLWGSIAGAWRSVGDFGQPQVIAWGRGFSALLGTTVVFITYQIGMRWGARHALLGAGLMAVTPTHVAVSREIGEGSVLAFFAALTLLLSLAAVERAHRRAFAFAGAAAGLAAASHYAGALTLALPLVAAWMTIREGASRIGRALTALAAFTAAFVIGMPLSVGDLPAFLNGFAIAASPSGPVIGGGVANIDILHELLWALQWPGLILAFSGLSLGIVRAITGPGHTRWTLLVSFPVIFSVMVAWHGATSDGSLLPILPSLTMLAAIAVISGVSLLRRFDIPRAARTGLIAALTVAAVLPPAVFSIEVVRQAGGHDTERSGRRPLNGRADTGR